mmetsp:Transcript_12843/g.15548  ORF Transcript_12843/g.15548 Transcript_12843/m.15548 type:complete len:364 (-) Transcript_12843:203-1294(-)
MGSSGSTVQKVGSSLANDIAEYVIAERVKYRDINKELIKIRQHRVNLIKGQKYSYRQIHDLSSINDLAASDLCVIGGFSKRPNRSASKKVCQDDAKISQVDDRLLMGLFDGHGPYGERAARTCSFLFDTLLHEHSSFEDNPAEAMVDTISKLHRKIVAAKDITAEYSGATTTLVTISHTQKMIYAAWVGDSRAILISTFNGWKNIQTIALTRDHDYSTDEEKQRINQSGGVVSSYKDGKGQDLGPLRCWSTSEMTAPGLAMSKSIGDTAAHSIGVNAEADSMEMEIPDDADHCILVVASDGVWNVMTNEEVGRFVASYMKNKKNEKRLASEKLCLEAQSHWFRRLQNAPEPCDDISAIVTVLY